MDIFLFAANFMSVATYFTDNLLRLRVLTACAATCLAVYFAARPEPLMAVVGWNLFFVALNLFQISRLLLLRRRGLHAA